MSVSAVFGSVVPPSLSTPRFVLRGLDGLRAVAVASVLAYHLWPQAVPGGLIGVDLFFVISGYLITALLLREAALTGRMHLPSFWLRRLRRLVPAMLLCVLVTCSLALLVGGDVLVGMDRQVLGALTYTSNWTSIAAGNDYFTSTAPELLTNFWSLGLEEQFYLAWPVVLVASCMVLRTWARRRLVPAVLATASLLTMLVLMLATGDLARAYYGLDSHAFGLMLGCTLALSLPWSMYPPRAGVHVAALEQARREPVELARTLGGWAGLVLFAVLAMSLSEEHPLLMAPWGLLLGSLAGLAVVQALLPDLPGTGAELLRGLLSLPPLVWIGRRSYGIYLWHWPLMVLARYAFPQTSATARGLVVLVLTVAVAAASYRWLEEPVRRHGFLGAARDVGQLLAGYGTGPRWVPFTVLGLVLLAVVGTTTAALTAPEQTEAERIVSQGQHAVQHQPRARSSAEVSATGTYVPSRDGSDVTVVGDSVTLGSAGHLQEAMPGVEIDAKVSRNVSAGIQVVQRLEDQHRLGRIVVVSLSTNSALAPQDVQTLRRIADADQKRAVVLVTGHGQPQMDWIGTSNQVIRQAAAENPQFVVADWDHAISEKEQLLASDGVHPQDAGQKIYAEVIHHAVEKAQRQLQQQTAGEGSGA